MVKILPGNAGDIRDIQCLSAGDIQSLSLEDPLERDWLPTPVFWPGRIPWTKQPGGL